MAYGVAQLFPGCSACPEINGKKGTTGLWLILLQPNLKTLSPNQLCRRPFEHFLVAGIHYVPGRLDAVSSLQVPNFEILLRRTTACLLVLCGLADKRPPCF